MKIISGSSNQPLAKSIAQKLNLDLIDCEISKFSNQEKRIYIKSDVKKEQVALIQSFSEPVDEHIMETLLIIDALERLGAQKVNLLIPWMGYSLQDKVFRDGEAIAAKVVANLFSQVYVQRIFLVDLHNKSIPGFFDVPTFHLTALNLFADYIKNNFAMNQAVIASPDFGGLKRANALAELLKLDLINIDKHRDLKTGQVKAKELHGEAQDKTVFLFDDVIVSGGTVVESARILKEQGAKAVYFLATHGIFCNQAIQKIEASLVDQVVVTNSINHQSNHKIQSLDLTGVLAEALQKWL